MKHTIATPTGARNPRMGRSQYMRVGILVLLLADATYGQLARSLPPTERMPFQLGVEQRVRNENWNNLFDFSDGADDQRNQIRYRTRLWIDVPLPSYIDAHVGVTQETNQNMGKRNSFDEVFFEMAYLEIHRLFTDKLSLRIGRQNLTKGEVFLISEGGPWDGSRALYFNGVDLSYSSKHGQLELIGIYNPKRDRLLPRFHDRQRLLVDWDEQALGLYLTKPLGAGSSVEGYYFIKRELRDHRAHSNAPFQPDRRINTGGMRVAQLIAPTLSLTGEFAMQRGLEDGGKPIRAWGGYAYAKRTFKHRFHPYVKAGYWGLSGSARTDLVGDWDPLFARGALYGDLNLYSEMYERTIGYSSNLKMAQVEAGFSPSKRVAYRFTYQHMDAFHPAGVRPAIFGSGCHRGENAQARVDFTINDALQGHLDFETLLPGSFYRVRDRAYFLRFELICRWTKRISS